MLELEFSNNTELKVDQAHLTAHLERILRRLSHPDTLRVEISIIGDTAIQQLNARYLDKNEATDVLSFNAPQNAEKLLGSIAIGAGRTKIQASQAGITIQTEIEMLSGHGLLHLLGYHHR